ncbi:hypothetical protein Golomagni_04700 [Golovinomyces magnicellulatus]|nr:hypothetical protein Golomagni_04700 [Golovinomyces magnicellulatus]
MSSAFDAMLVNINIPHTSHLNQILHLTTVPRVIAVLASLFVVGYYFFHRSRRLNFPVVGSPKDVDFRKAILEGVAKYPNTPFIVPGDPIFVVAPKSTINEIKNFDNDTASFARHLQDVYQAQITNVGEFEDGCLISVIKNDYSRQLVSVLSILQEEAAYGFETCLGPSTDWTEFKLYPKLTRIVTLISGRVFFGLPLSRTEEFIEASINFTVQATNVKDCFKRKPRWYRYLLSPFYKEVKCMIDFKERFMEIFGPIIDANIAKEGNEKPNSKEGDDQGKLISFFLDRMPPEKRGDLKYMTTLLLNLSFASIFTTSITALHIIYDLATYREYIPILVDEIKEVMAEEGCETTADGNMRLRKTSLPKLLKLDSFLKESQRISPLSIVILERVVTSYLKLSTGHVIPKGTHLVFPSWEVYTGSSSLHVDGLTKPLNEFDGLRYLKLRQLPGNANRHFFVSTSPDSLEFGYGVHACPGRFIANNQIKVIIIELLMNWDFRFSGDVKMEGGAWRRPKNRFMKFEIRADQEASLEFRRKKD